MPGASTPAIDATPVVKPTMGPVEPSNAALADQIHVEPASSTPVLDMAKQSNAKWDAKWDEEEEKGTLTATRANGGETATTKVAVGESLDASTSFGTAPGTTERGSPDGVTTSKGTTISASLGEKSKLALEHSNTTKGPGGEAVATGKVTADAGGVTLGGSRATADPSTASADKLAGSVKIGAGGVTEVGGSYGFGGKDAEGTHRFGVGYKADLAKGTQTFDGNLGDAKGSLTVGKDGWKGSMAHGENIAASFGHSTAEDGSTTTSAGLEVGNVPGVKKVGANGSYTAGNGQTKVAGGVTVGDYGVNGSYTATDREARSDDEGLLTSSHEAGTGFAVGGKGKVPYTQTALSGSAGWSWGTVLGLTDTVPAEMSEEGRDGFLRSLEKRRVRAESEGIDVSRLDAGAGISQSVLSGDEWGAGASMFVADVGGKTVNDRTVTRSLQRAEDGTFTAAFARRRGMVDTEAGAFAGFGGSHVSTESDAFGASFTIDPSKPGGMRDAQAFVDLGVLPGALPAEPERNSAAGRIVVALEDLAGMREEMAGLDPSAWHDTRYRMLAAQRAKCIADVRDDVTEVNEAFEQRLRPRRSGWMGDVNEAMFGWLDDAPSGESASAVTSVTDHAGRSEHNDVYSPFHAADQVEQAATDQTQRDPSAGAATTSATRTDEILGTDLRYAVSKGADRPGGGPDRRLSFTSVDRFDEEEEPTEALEKREGIGGGVGDRVAAQASLDLDAFGRAASSPGADPAWQRMARTIAAWWRHPDTQVWMDFHHPGAIPRGLDAAGVATALGAVCDAEVFADLSPALQDLFWQTLVWKDDDRVAKGAPTDNEDVFDALVPISQLPEDRRDAALKRMMDAAAASGDVTRKWAEASRRLPPALSEVLEDATTYFEPLPAAEDARKLDTKKRAALLAGLDLDPRAGAKVIEVLTGARLAGGPAEIDAVIEAGEHPVTDLFQCVMNERDQRFELFRLLEGSRSDAVLAAAIAPGGALYDKAARIMSDGLVGNPERSTVAADFSVTHVGEAEIKKANAEVRFAAKGLLASRSWGWSDVTAVAGAAPASADAIAARLADLKKRGATPVQLDQVMAGCGTPGDWAQKVLCAPEATRSPGRGQSTLRDRLVAALVGTRFLSDALAAERALLASRQSYYGGPVDTP